MYPPLAAALARGKRVWIRFWMRYAGVGFWGRWSTRLASLLAPPYNARIYLARLNPQGYIDPSASIHHSDLHLGNNVFIADRVALFQIQDGGRLEIGDRVHVFRDTVIATGHGENGRVSIGADTFIHPRCQIMGYVGPITIGSAVMIAPNCSLYAYNHETTRGKPMNSTLYSKGGIVIGDGSWLGVGVIVLDGTRIGKGAVIGAGSVVTHDIPDEAIAMGVPARVVRMRTE